MNQNENILKENCSNEFYFHFINDIPMNENIFRPCSYAFFKLINEARELNKKGLYETKNSDEHFLINETDLGKIIIKNNKEIFLDFPMLIEKKSKKRKKVELNKPKRGGKKKYYVDTINPETGKIIRVEFGDKNMRTGIRDPKRVKSFVARHRCKTHANDKTKPSYWSCRLPRYIKFKGAENKLWW